MIRSTVPLSWGPVSYLEFRPETAGPVIVLLQPGLAAFEQWQRDEIRWNLLRTDYTTQLTSFPRPALIVHGDRDTGVPVARARVAAELIPDAELHVIADAGHWVQRDRPEAVIDAMLDFLGRPGAG